MHAGNPVMANDVSTFEMISVGKDLYTEVPWGFYHQLGHNHQDEKWTVQETVEVTCNIYSLYLMYKMNNISIT